MEALNIPEEKKSPRIIMDAEKGLFEISGRSFPDNAMGFYQPLMDWLDEYVTAPNPETEFSFRFTYHNSSTNKIIHDILARLKKIQDAGGKILVRWEYEEEDEDTKLEGEDFSSRMDLPFNIVKV